MYSVVAFVRLTEQCRKPLNSLRNTLTVCFLWIPGYRDIEGNVQADKLARQAFAFVTLFPDVVKQQDYIQEERIGFLFGTEYYCKYAG